jgi:hypothetical protein
MAHGEINGIHAGQHFDSRQALCAADALSETKDLRHCLIDG